uniref:Prothymosin alpha n=1 Tax=Equus caballus TaxID=9796 RepID=A0A3Q2HR48_HORSE
MSYAAVDTSSKITTMDLKEKKEVVEEAENGGDTPARGNTSEGHGEQDVDKEGEASDREKEEE